MKTTPKEFNRSGWHFRQIFREGEIAVFERSRLPDMSQQHFETVRLKPYSAGEVFGRVIEAGESYPSSEEWGTYGFTLSDKTAARAKADEMLARFRANAGHS